GIESSPVHPGEQTVIRVLAVSEVRASVRRAPVSGAGHDETMEPFERAAVIAKPQSQPIEQLRMRWCSAHMPEVVWGVDDAATEMIMPDSVHDTAPRERVVTVNQPLSQRRAARTLILHRRHTETGCNALHTFEGARRGFLAGTANVAAMQNMDQPWFAGRLVPAIRLEITGRGEDKLRWRQRSEFPFYQVALLQSGNFDPFLGSARLRLFRQDGSNLFRKCSSAGRRAIGNREPQSSNEMPPAMKLLHDECQFGVGCDAKGFYQLKHAIMRLANPGENAPRRFLVSVNRVRDGPAFLIEIGRRPL